MAEYLAGKGVEVHGVDWPGHGRTAIGKRGEVGQSFEQVYEFMTAVIDSKRPVDGTPLYLVSKLVSIW